MRGQFEWDDVISNTIGAVLGLGVYRLLEVRLTTERMTNILAAAALICVIICVSVYLYTHNSIEADSTSRAYWRAYKKHHWLKPLCWLYQIFRYAKQGFKFGRSYNQLSTDLENGNNRYELLKDLGVVFET